MIKKKNYWKNEWIALSSFLVSDVSESLIALKSNEQCERMAQVAHQKWATMSDSLRSLRGNEQSWANGSEFKWANSQTCRKPMSELPALIKNNEIQIE